MRCARCRTRIKKGALACTVCLVSLGGASAVEPPRAVAPTVTASRNLPAMSGRRAEHEESPHAPEIECPQLPGQEIEVLEEHVLVLDHPRYGLLNGLNYLGYCDTCPLAAQRALCSGPCPGEKSAIGAAASGASESHGNRSRPDDALEQAQRAPPEQQTALRCDLAEPAGCDPAPRTAWVNVDADQDGTGHR